LPVDPVSALSFVHNKWRPGGKSRKRPANMPAQSVQRPSNPTVELRITVNSSGAVKSDHGAGIAQFFSFAASIHFLGRVVWSVGGDRLVLDDKRKLAQGAPLDHPRPGYFPIITNEIRPGHESRLSSLWAGGAWRSLFLETGPPPPRKKPPRRFPNRAQNTAQKNGFPLTTISSFVVQWASLLTGHASMRCIQPGNKRGPQCVAGNWSRPVPAWRNTFSNGIPSHRPHK